MYSEIPGGSPQVEHKLNWRGRVDRALKERAFSAEDEELASEWETCATTELFGGDFHRQNGMIEKLGNRFYWAMEIERKSKPGSLRAWRARRRVARIYERIERYRNEIG